MASQLWREMPESDREPWHKEAWRAFKPAEHSCLIDVLSVETMDLASLVTSLGILSRSPECFHADLMYPEPAMKVQLVTQSIELDWPALSWSAVHVAGDVPCPVLVQIVWDITGS